MEIDLPNYLVGLIVLLALAIFLSPWWWIAVGLIAGMTIFTKVAYRRWPWNARKQILVNAKDLPVIEGSLTFLPPEFFEVCRNKRCGAMRAPFAAMGNLVAHVIDASSMKDTDVAIIHRTALRCAECDCRISDTYQNSFWVEAAQSLTVLSIADDDLPMPTADHRCPQCGSSMGLFVYDSRH